MHYRMAVLLVSIFLLSGCTAVLSEQARKSVTSDAPFRNLKEKPDSYIGKNVLLGGRIAGIRNSNDGAWLEIVQFELAGSSYPEDQFESNGRFLATSSGFLDPLVFRQGMLITLVGELKGKKTARLDEMDYTYPVISLREWYLWPGSQPDRGCSTYPSPAPQYNPYNYGYGNEPFLQRPNNSINAPR